MKRERKYLLAILSISVLSVYFLLILLDKYVFLSIGHFVEFCQQFAQNFLSSGLEYIGFVLSIVTFVALMIFLSKTVLSYMKTKRRLMFLLDKRMENVPNKLLLLLNKNGILVDKVIVIHSDNDIALTINWLNPRIIFSSSLIEKLNINELESVVLHEHYHFVNKHPFMLLVGEILSSSLFFMPFISDLNNILKSAMENAADSFVLQVQGDSNLLDSALSKVKNTNNFLFYPSFSRRNEYGIGKRNVFVSIIVVLVGIALYAPPTQAHAPQTVFDKNKLDCGISQQCSTRCDGDELLDEIHMSENILQSLLMSSSKY